MIVDSEIFKLNYIIFWIFFGITTTNTSFEYFISLLLWWMAPFSKHHLHHQLPILPVWTLLKIVYLLLAYLNSDRRNCCLLHTKMNVIDDIHLEVTIILCCYLRLRSYRFLTLEKFLTALMMRDGDQWVSSMIIMITFLGIM